MKKIQRKYKGNRSGGARPSSAGAQPELHGARRSSAELGRAAPESEKNAKVPKVPISQVPIKESLFQGPADHQKSSVFSVEHMLVISLVFLAQTPGFIYYLEAIGTSRNTKALTNMQNRSAFVFALYIIYKETTHEGASGARRSRDFVKFSRPGT